MGVVSDENLRKLACCKSLVQFSDIMTPECLNSMEGFVIAEMCPSQTKISGVIAYVCK
jgi:hypothetical protein